MHSVTGEENGDRASACPQRGGPAVEFSTVPGDSTAACENGHKWELGVLPDDEPEGAGTEP